jgi:hypothetical protein
MTFLPPPCFIVLKYYISNPDGVHDPGVFASVLGAEVSQPATGVSDLTVSS